MQPSAIAAQPGIAVPPSDRAGSAAGISARMDRLPTTRHLWVLVLLLSLGGWFEIYDLIFTGYIAPGLTKSGLLATMSPLPTPTRVSCVIATAVIRHVVSESGK